MRKRASTCSQFARKCTDMCADLTLVVSKKEVGNGTSIQTGTQRIYNLSGVMISLSHSHSHQIEFDSILSMSVSLLFEKCRSAFHSHMCVCVLTLAIYSEWNSLEICVKFTQVSLSSFYPPCLPIVYTMHTLFLSHTAAAHIWKFKITAHELDQYEEVKTSGVHWVLSDLNWHKLGGFLLADLMGTDSDWLTLPERTGERQSVCVWHRMVDGYETNFKHLNRH